jgi:hypothetical protein
VRRGIVLSLEFVPKEKCDNEEHPEKQPGPIVSMESGNVTQYKSEHEHMCAPIDFKTPDCENEIPAVSGQPAKQKSP